MLDFSAVSPLQTQLLGNPIKSIDVEAVAVSLHIAIRAREMIIALHDARSLWGTIEQNLPQSVGSKIPSLGVLVLTSSTSVPQWARARWIS